MKEKLIVFISSRINDEMKRARQAVRQMESYLAEQTSAGAASRVCTYGRGDC